MRRLDNATQFTMPDTLSADQLRQLYSYPDKAGAWLRVNFVTTLDGAISVDGRSGPLGGPGDRLVFNTLRELADVILVGAGTVRAEDYGGAKVPGAQQKLRTARGQDAIPPIAIVSASGELDPGSRVFTETQTPTIVFTSGAASAANIAALTAAGAVVHQSDSDRVELTAAIEQLARQGLRKILCEGGPRLFGELLEHDAADELCLTINPLLTAGDAPRIAVSGASVLHRMRQEHLLLDHDGTLLGRWVRDREST